ncbi:G-type lectin S-receptor-like serine/threonine-protein kinase B120 [Ziziphus jujuba]|uniref:Receptor-like serine/threonine-protein kinase n=1 Tax=Ziziphus jujuba TaxID=326968 RepID=A0ABM4ACU5_ZIZJJ|nr:G-type lectin S-receptor-like serine/threonine-protein kinase B120 [Ziziphus jujuba]
MRRTSSNMVVLLFLVFLWLLHFKLSSAEDTLTPANSIRDWDFLESPNKLFRLRFFNLGYSGDRYLGIQYMNYSDMKIVWVANQENPLNDTSGILNITKDGNLVIGDSHGTSITINSQTPPSMSSNTSAILLDSGNFILKAGEQILWQSFDHPSDTILPGMKLGMFGLKLGQPQKIFLTSWVSPGVPASGAFTLGIDPNNTDQLSVWQRGSLYWHSGKWNGQNFSYFPDIDASYKFRYISNENESYYTYSVPANYNSWIELNSSGEIHMFLGGNYGWSLWNLPTCDANGNYKSKGCIDQKLSKCSSGDQFLLTSGLMNSWESLPNRSIGLNDCAEICRKECSCKAYASAESDGTGCKFSYGQKSDEIDRYFAEFFYFRNSTNSTMEGKNSTHTKKSGPSIIKEKPKKRQLWVSIVVPLISLIVVGLVFCALCYFKLLRCCSRGKRGISGDVTMSTEVLIRELKTSMASIDVLSGTNKQKLNGKHDHELPLFNFPTIETATRYFSCENKLGQGGYGPVYKGTLADGQEIAVKRLSTRSGQGLEEFKNEVMLISKLQHRNLVRLLGCCIKGEEKILVYEYLPNKSLDSFLFDATKQLLLDWRKRTNIIEGIAQGLLYLHKYSRLRIIHRDLKTSNILLDKNMNSKISDFGTAKIFGDNESRASTIRIVGTYGYMSPEYAMDGLFSEKSDVFSFGVMVLEILSGKKHSACFDQTNEYMRLLEYAWNLWKDGRCLELMDPSVRETCNSTDEFIRRAQVALLCVQEVAADRPNMADVVSMLGGDAVTPPHPKQPAFSILKRADKHNMSDNPEAYTVNDVSFSGIGAR